MNKNVHRIFAAAAAIVVLSIAGYAYAQGAGTRDKFSKRTAPTFGDETAWVEAWGHVDADDVGDNVNATDFLRRDGTWAVPAGGGGSEPSDGDKTDVTVSGSGLTWNIDADTITTTELANFAVDTANINSNAVTYGRMQQVAASRLLGNPTGLTADVSEISLNGTLSFTGSSLQRAALTGDVTAAAGSNATDIATGVVGTNEIATDGVGSAEIADGSIVNADVSASADLALSKLEDIATNRLVGNVSGGAAAPTVVIISGGLESTGGTSLQRSALTGDVTAGAGSNSTTIANDAVTFAKFQNVTGPVVVGRVATSSGDTSAIPLGGTARGHRVFTSGTSFAKTDANVRYLMIEMVGGGGGGGGAAATGVGQASVGSGGGAGGFLRVFVDVTAEAGPFTIAIGGGGAGVSGGTGVAGGATTFAIGATTYTAAGGSGGTASTAASTVITQLGGSSGSPLNGDINATGGDGRNGARWSATIAMSGAGGSSFFGSGGPSQVAAGVGAAARTATYGAGGGGALNYASTAAKAGGAGAQGIISVTEFY